MQHTIRAKRGTLVTSSNLSRHGSGVAVPSSHNSSSSSTSCADNTGDNVRHFQRDDAQINLTVTVQVTVRVLPTTHSLTCHSEVQLQACRRGNGAMCWIIYRDPPSVPRPGSKAGRTGALGGSRSATGPPPPPFSGSTALGAAIRRARPASGPSRAAMVYVTLTGCPHGPRKAVRVSSRAAMDLSWYAWRQARCWLP